MPANPSTTDPHTNSSYDDASLLAMIKDTLSPSQAEQLAEATVLEVGTRTVLLKTSCKSDGVISLNEFKDTPNLKAGDTIEVYIEAEENRHGEHVISRKKAKKLRAWQTIEEAYRTQQSLVGKVEGRVKGGLEVNIHGITTFLPGSQIDTSPVTDFDAYLKQSIEVMVIGIKPDKQNAVISRRALFEHAQKALIDNLHEGQILEGIVKNITDFGVFVELTSGTSSTSGIVGLVYVKETVWDKKVNDPRQAKDAEGNPLFVEGQPVKVVVKEIESKQDNSLPRIALSTKELLPNPWDNLPQDLAVGSTLTARVTTLKERGICVQVQEGVEGFVHISEMSLSPYVQDPSELVEVGQEVQLQVLKLDPEEQDIRLGMKQLLSDPWEVKDFLDTYGLNTRHQAVVRKYAEKNKGVYLEIKPGIEGYLDNDHISWTEKILRANAYFQLGTTHEVIILGVNDEDKMLKLGMRELQDSPWDSFEETFTIGSEHDAVVKQKHRMGTILELPYGLQTFVINKELVKEDNTPVQEGETLKVRVTDFIKYEHKVLVSHTATYQAPQAAAKASPKAAVTNNIHRPVQKTTLSDLGALSKLKEKFAEQEKQDAAEESAQDDKT